MHEWLKLYDFDRLRVFHLIGKCEARPRLVQCLCVATPHADYARGRGYGHERTKFKLVIKDRQAARLHSQQSSMRYLLQDRWSRRAGLARP